MLVPEHVQHAMHHEPKELLAHAPAVRQRISARDARRDVHVADDVASGVDGGEAERDHVRRTAVAQMLAVERGDATIGDERHRQDRVSHPLGAQHGIGERRHSRARNGNAHALRRYVYYTTHTLTA